MNKQEFIKNNYININNITEEDLKVLANEESQLFFDTESCPDFPQEIVEKYDLTNIEYDTLKEFEVIEKGSLLYELKRNKQLKSKIYVFMVGCNLNDKVYYGNTIDEFMKFIESIDTYRAKNKIKITTFNIYCHNLSWDMEFIKYWIKDNQLTQIKSGHTTSERKKTYKQELAFEIIENNNSTHNARIQLANRTINRKKIMTSMLFIDSMKITPLSLAKISKELIKVDEVFIKNSEVYKYNLVRNEKEYTPDLIESWYQYCDIYLLKEWYNQFVIPNYIENGIKPFTISQISFDSIIKKSFEKDVKEGKYDFYIDKKGKVDNRKIYEEHYGLKYIERYEDIKEYIQTSYKGGITTLGKKYRELAKVEEVKGISIDITSSYPSQIIKKPLPYGKPLDIKEGKYEDAIIFGELYNFHFITIGFDGWHSRIKGNQFGLPVKIKKITDSEAEQLGWTPNEYYTTNCIDFEYVGENRVELVEGKRAEKINKLPYKYIITLTHYEYEMLNKMFEFVHFENEEMIDGVHFIDYISFKSEIGFMKDGMEYYFNMKNEGSRIGNKAMEYNSKIICNSFYGKNCSKRNRQQRFYDLSKEDNIITYQPITEANRNEWLDDKMYAVQYGSAVTSWGRIQLMETIFKLGCDKFVYADTDSIKLANTTKEELIEMCNEKGIELSLSKEDKRIGDWDFEYEFEDFKAIAQKKYMYKVKNTNNFNVKCSGLPESIRRTIKTKEEFELGAKFIKYGKSKVYGGYLLLPVEFTINDNSIM